MSITLIFDLSSETLVKEEAHGTTFDNEAHLASGWNDVALSPLGEQQSSLYTQTNARMKSFLDDLKKNYAGKRVMVIGHRATQYGIENIVNGVSLEKLTSTHFKWQPGWRYEV